MTDEKKVATETVSKALNSLQELAKGHSSRGTATTEVESMSGAGMGAGSDQGSTQVHHTPSNSDPKTWAGTSQTAVPEDGATDGVGEDGTDYKGVPQGLMKSIFEKIEKGEALSQAEQFVLKSVMKGGSSSKASPTDSDLDDTKKAQDDSDKDDKDEYDEEAKKSLADHANSNEDVQKGLELSPFLAGWAEVQAEAANSMEQRIVSRISKSLSEIDEENSKFQSEMAKSVAALAEVMSLQGQRLEQLESTPARGPKSQAQPVEKSFGPGGQSQGEELSKSQVIDTMIDMVQKGQLNAQDVVQFESTSELRPDIYQQVLAHRQGR